MARIEFKNDQTRALEEVEGSDGRLNVSSRSDGRAYYISRDNGQAYSATFAHASAADAEYSWVLQNTSTTRTLVIEHVGINATTISRSQLVFVTGTTAAGIVLTPRNLNAGSTNDAECTFTHDGSGTPITIGSASGIPIDDVNIGIHGHEEFRLADTVRLGQNDAIACQLITGDTTPLITGVVFFFFE